MHRLLTLLLWALLLCSPALSDCPVKGGSPDVKVWVNTDSGVYHCPGTRWYGKTKSGDYMRQDEAQKKCFRPAYGHVCK